jgi:glycosyltransferase involved in cell wall biosynthesis
MRVIWLIDSLGPGGAERVTYSIMKHFDKEHFDFRVCVLQVKLNNPIAKELKKIGIPVDMVPVPYLRHPANLPRLLRYLSRNRPDLIHTQLEFSDTLGSLAAKLLGIPSVSTLHTLETPIRGTSEFLRLQLMWASLRYCCNRIITVSESTRIHHIQIGKLPSKKVITIYNGIDLSGFREIDRMTVNKKRKSLNLPIGAPVFITVAVLREMKGIQFMLDAMTLMLKKIPNLYYLIVGEGEYGVMLKKVVESFGLEDHVIFAGQRNDIPDLLAISDIFVLPTLRDALPTVLIEAMAAKIPIIASDVGGVPEIVVNGENGLLVPPANPLLLADACIQLVKDKSRANALAESGLKIARERFDIHDQVERLSNLYQELTKGSPKNVN